MVIFVLLDFIGNELSASLGWKAALFKLFGCECNKSSDLSHCLPVLPFLENSFIFILAQSVINLRFQGAAIVDQPVCIIRWGAYTDEPNPWISSWGFDENSGSTVCFKILQYAVD